jgi:HPt (histidine-containing phosphotransfer) domain-containing protein
VLDDPSPPRIAAHDTPVRVDRLDARIVSDLVNVYADDREELIRVLGIFERDVNSKLKAIIRAVGTSDFDAINALGHGLTGAAAMFGAARLSGLSADLQRFAKASDAGAVGDAIAQIAREWPLSRAELHRIMAR